MWLRNTLPGPSSALSPQCCSRITVQVYNSRSCVEMWQCQCHCPSAVPRGAGRWCCHCTNMAHPVAIQAHGSGKTLDGVCHIFNTFFFFFLNQSPKGRIEELSERQWKLWQQVSPPKWGCRGTGCVPWLQEGAWYSWKACRSVLPASSPACSSQ